MVLRRHLIYTVFLLCLLPSLVLGFQRLPLVSSNGRSFTLGPLRSSSFEGSLLREGKTVVEEENTSTVPSSSTSSSSNGNGIRTTSAALQQDFLRKNKRELITLAFIALIATLSAVTVPLFFSRVLGILTSPNFRFTKLLRALAAMVLVHTIEPLMTVFFVRHSSVLIDRFITSLRALVFSTLLRREVAVLESSSTASATQLVIGEVDKIKQSAMQNISRDRGLRALLELLFGLSILYTLCWPLALMFSVIIPITSYISSRFANRMFKAAATEGKTAVKQTSRAMETIANFKEVFSFSNQPLEECRFAEVQAEASRAAVAVGRAKAVTEASNRAGIYTNIIAMFTFGGWLVSKHYIQPIVLVSFLSYCWSLNFATQGLLFSYGDVRTAAASWQKLRLFLDDTTTTSTTNTATTIPKLDHEKGQEEQFGISRKKLGGSPLSSFSTPSGRTRSSMRIDFDHVSFSYANRPDVPVLNDLSLHIPEGKITALVGPSGAGKSTIAALLNGFYDPSKGSLLVNGLSRSAVLKDQYLSQVSMVRQTPALFTDTVASNIAYGAVAYRSVTRDEIIQAAKQANADTFIRRLPEGYDTKLGDGTGFVQLSGGQKQVTFDPSLSVERIAIARALLKDASLLILDEATSALDSESESLVQDALNKLIQGRTTVIIAHRLSTVINADQIAFVKDGTIAEIGTHETLMAKKGLYHGLMGIQMSGYDEAGMNI